MNKELLFTVDDVKHIDYEQYDSDDYMMAKVKFLSTRPNAHDIVISEDVLRQYSKTVLGKWITADIKYGDCTSHTNEQIICGMIPKEQDVEFVVAEDGYLDAYVDCVISKRYAKDYCNVFSEFDNNRSVSIEAAFVMDEANKNKAVSFDIKTVTTLGKFINPAVPTADITITRFSEKQANEYYTNCWAKIKSFSIERNNVMEEELVNHPINTSKDAVYTGKWDGEKAKQDLIKEEKYEELAPKVCLRLEEGWEDRKITKLGYPVMGLYNGEWRYSTQALASAKAYATQNDEYEILNKIEKIYKELELDETAGKEEKMEEKVEISETEETFASEPEAVKEDATMTEEVVEETKTDDETECECSENMSEEDILTKIEQLTKDIEERNHIIMGKDAELEELRAYKAAVVAKEMACRVDEVMGEIRNYVNEEQFNAFKSEGLACDEKTIDAWSNKVKATCFNEVKKNIKKDDKGMLTFAMPTVVKHYNSHSIWEKLENK